MKLYEELLEIPAAPSHADIIPHVQEHLAAALPEGAAPIRFVISATRDGVYHCEVGVFEGLSPERRAALHSIFELRRRKVEDTERFNVVFLIPTGIGCELGGHAGDANAAAKLFASACDTFITHPNVVNASDINELPDNGLYVEGSVISRLMMGTIGLERVRANRVLTLVDEHPDELFTNATINAVSAARASYGLKSPPVVRLDPPVRLTSHWAKSGRAAGEVQRLDALLEALDAHRDEFDAIALSTQIEVPVEYHVDYYEAAGEMLNPWGGVEAIFTHALSSLYDVPAAHAPMLESRAIAGLDLGEVDPRMAAEVISTTFFMCVLRGLHHSPRIVDAEGFERERGVLTVEDVSCLIIPDKAVGLPTLAALEQGVPVIAVRENRNILDNDLTALPWADGQLHVVENYWEALGVMQAIKVGVDPMSVRRPLRATGSVREHRGGDGHRL